MKNSQIEKIKDDFMLSIGLYDLSQEWSNEPTMCRRNAMADKCKRMADECTRNALFLLFYCG